MAILLSGSAPVRAAGAPEPLWAYGFLTPPQPGDKAAPQAAPGPRGPRPNQDLAEQTRPRQAEGSDRSFSLVDIRDARNAIDWFPGEHGPMPDVVAHGPAAGTGNTARACASCHLSNGRGRPENAPVSGQPVAYFLRQLQDFRSDNRHSADPRKPNPITMVALAKAMSDDEMKAAAEYFGSIKWSAPWIRVVETDLVPKTKISGNLFIATETARTEPIAGRIIEVPENEEQAETLRNAHSGFVAYVPVGSVKKGENLVKTGGMSIVDGAIVPGKTIMCVTCHGPDLMGLADVPGIAGRSPSYLVRQLYDLQQGTRKGASSPLMQPIVANLTDDDFVAIGAYLASLAPPAK